MTGGSAAHEVRAATGIAGDRAVVLAPHLDDAALSLGGTIHRLGRCGVAVTVVTVFTADQEPGTPLSPLAEANHRAWGIGDAPFRERREEDVRAAAVLGYEAVHLGLLDAVYRRGPDGRPFYGDDVVDVGVDPDDAAAMTTRIAVALRDTLAGLEGARVFCPLSAATHVDHVLVRAAAESVVGAGAMTYYEEFPYVWWTFRRRDPSADAFGMRPSIVTLGEDDVQRRIDAICCYPSQLAGLFPSRGDIVRRGIGDRVPAARRIVGQPSLDAAVRRLSDGVREHVGLVGGERVWRYS